MVNNDLTTEGERRVETWLRAKRNTNRASVELDNARLAESNAECELAKWLLPDDVRPGEKIAVWYGDSLIQVEFPFAGGGGGGSSGGGGNTTVSVRIDSSPRVTIRKRGPKLNV